MKCYFTFNNDIENNKIYLDMLELALRTARKNTTLDLYALYEGTKEDKLYSILKKYNVNVQICKLSFYDLLENFYDEQYKKEFKFEMTFNEIKYNAEGKMRVLEWSLDGKNYYSEYNKNILLKDIRNEQ